MQKRKRLLKNSIVNSCKTTDLLSAPFVDQEDVAQFRKADIIVDLANSQHIVLNDSLLQVGKTVGHSLIDTIETLY